MLGEDHRWKTTFDGRQTLIEDYLHWKKTWFKEISRLRSAIYRHCGNFLSSSNDSIIQNVSNWSLNQNIWNVGAHQRTVGQMICSKGFK